MKKFIPILFIALALFACNSSSNNSNTGKDNDTINIQDTISSEVEETEEDNFDAEKILEKIDEPYDIGEYFLLLPDSLILDIPLKERPTMLEVKNDMQKVDEHGLSYHVQTIDFNNAYMLIKDFGGGGGFDIEITYFVKSDKTRLIAVNTTQWDMQCSQSKLHFYTYSNQIWTDISSEIIPEININSFSKTKVNIDEAPINVKLPQNGKTIKVSLSLEGLADWVDENDYKKIEKQLFCTKYDLKWNDGTFSVANKIKE